MTLVLRGITLNEEPMSQPLIGRFDERGGSVGRSDDATLTLPDPERMISRLQAQVLHRDGQYWIENVSAATPILHNGRPLSTAMRVVLRDGDEIRIGGYALQVTFEDDATSATILRGRTLVPPPKSLLTTPLPPPVPVESPRKPVEPPRNGAPGSLAEPRRNVDSSGSFAEPRRYAADLSGTLSEPLRPLPPYQRAPDPPPDNTVGSLWRSFVDGAGIDLPLPNGPSPQLLGTIGEMMKIAVAGIQRLVTMRARAKSEMQAEMTMLQPRDNNPLKFSPDPALALQMLLQPPARGFLPGPAALRDALGDLQSHQVGMTAGMRAILEAVLDRLDPVKLEALPTKRSPLDWLRPERHKADLWDLYLKQYQSLREEAYDNFQRFFGEAFREAYEAQVRSLDATDDPRPPPGPKAGGTAR